MNGCQASMPNSKQSNSRSKEKEINEDGQQEKMASGCRVVVLSVYDYRTPSMAESFIFLNPEEIPISKLDNEQARATYATISLFEN